MIGLRFNSNNKILRSVQLPFSGAQRWLLPRAPSILALLLIALMCVSLAWQSLAWQRLLHSSTAAPVSPTSTQTSAAAQTSLLPLFSSPANGASASAPDTNLRLTLMGSFVHVDAARSSAIIALEGSKAKRYRVGGQLSDGVSLHAVYRDRVELKRNGRLETLAFKLRPQLASAPSLEPTPDDNLEQLQQLEEESGNQLRERMQELQQQMQAAETPVDAPTEQPKQTD
jgi:general secretion pathway protein C